jgi:glycosyltransferase involved in cell wall biosynthesis
LKIVHIVSSIAEEASGLSVAVPALCSALAACGHDVELHSLASGAGTPTIPSVRTILHPVVRFPSRRLGRSPEMERALRIAARTADILHSHSLWLMPTIYPSRAVAGTACKLVTSPHGTLAPWPLRRSWSKKRVMWALLQRRAVLRSDCLHATAEAEVDDIRRADLQTPVAVIPNGVSLPTLGPRLRRDGERRLLFLGRVHPKKGVDVLLGAWRRVQERFPRWHLDIVGPDNEGHLARMRRLAATLGVVRVTFRGPVYGEEKSRTYFD